MQKIGLFDLIDKFNTVANGKNDFSNKRNPPSSQKDESLKKPKFVDPQTPPPIHYVMNAKMLEFCIRHDNFAKGVKR